MPDIEAFGDRFAILNRVTAVVKDAPYAKDISLIQGPSYMTDLDHKCQDTLRVYLTDKFPHRDDLIARLKTLSMDIEVVKLDQYIPKGS